MDRWRTYSWLAVSAGIALRVSGLGASAIWYDESFSLAMARLPLLDMIRTAALDFNPPLWEMIAWVSVRIFGVNEIGLRAPALVASILTLLLARYLAHTLLPDMPAALGVGAVALLPYQLWMAQEGRMYAMMSLLYLFAFALARRGRWLGLSAVLGLLLYSHMTAPFYCAAVGLYALVKARGERTQVLVTGATAISAFLPWATSYLHSATAKDFWYVPRTLGWIITALVRATMADAMPGEWWQAVAMLTLLGSLVAGLLITAQRRESAALSLCVIALGPFLLMLAVMPLQNVIFYRTLSALTVPLLLWLGATLVHLPGVWLRSLFGAAWALMAVSGLVAWQPAAKGGELRDVAEFVNDAWRPGDVIYHATATTELPFEFYLNHPAYLLDERQHDGLLAWEVQDALGVQRAALEDIPHKRAWVVWALDGFMSERAIERMEGYTANGVLVAYVHYWQAAKVAVWLVDK